jgi:TonB-linked SusC/RagA family outer membrane protein
MDLRKKTIIALALMLCCSLAPWGSSSEVSAAGAQATQQKKGSISGTVKDKEGDAVIGVSVSVKGTPSIGTVTDIDGKFTLNNVAPNATLVFSFVGMKTQEVSTVGKTTLAVVLEPNAISMDELVVVGFGTQKKVNLTGAVASVDTKALETRPVQNVAQALQGVVAGLNISQNQGGLDSRPAINIRGTGTIGSGSSGAPLILIDGTEGDINAINPQDIENISVLKDAGASAVYGSRAPFGVILITTKKGKAGEPVINYNNSFKRNSPLLLPNMLDSYRFALYFNEASKNSGSGAFFNDEWLKRIKDYQAGALINPKNGLPMSSVPNGSVWADYGGANDNVNWYKAIFKDWAPSQEHSVSVSGGNDRTTYYISGNFLDQDGLMRFGGDKFSRYAATAKITTKLTDKVSIGYNSRWIREDYARPSSLTNGLFQDLARQGWPILPLYDPNGYLMSSPSPALGLRDRGRDRKQTDWLYQQLRLDVELAKGWKLIGEFNYKTIDEFRHWDTQKTYNHDVNGNPVPYETSTGVHEGASRSNFFNPNIFTEYARSFKDHNFKVMAGFQAEQFNDRDLTADKSGIINASLPTLNTTDGNNSNGLPVAPSVSGGYGNWSTMGFFGRFNYDYAGKYLVEANMRYDGTSRFMSDKRWNLFPSVSVGWNVSKEKFWEPLTSYVNNLKFRASYGSLGNQNTKSEENYRLAYYAAIQTVPFKASEGSWLVNGIKPNYSSAPALVSSTLTWEKIRTWDAGLDLGMFNSRLTASFDYFVRFTNDMLAEGVELPAILGTKVPFTNNTDQKTRGFELSLSWQDRLDNGLGYGIKVAVSDSRTKITKYPNPTGTFDKYVEGRETGEIWGFETKGIAKSDKEMSDYLATLPNGGQNALGSNWLAGDIMYVDLNNDGKIDKGGRTINDHGDLKVIGNNNPRFPFSVDLSADWKGFDFRAFFQGIMKRDYFQDSYYFWGAWKWGIWWSTGLEEHLDYFRADASNPLGQNLDSYYPRPLFGDGKNMETQTRYLQNAAYIRLKNLQLGYTLPANLTKKVGVSKLRVFVSGENLWTYTKMAKMFDPETIDGGYRGNVYPLFRVYSCGLSLSL